MMMMALKKARNKSERDEAGASIEGEREKNENEKTEDGSILIYYRP